MELRRRRCARRRRWRSTSAARRDPPAVVRSLAAADAPRPMYEFGWNHTTLHALRYDKSATYLQAVLAPERALELVQAHGRKGFA